MNSSSIGSYINYSNGIVTSTCDTSIASMITLIYIIIVSFIINPSNGTCRSHELHHNNEHFTICELKDKKRK